jgi:hypothetical protein
MDLKTFVSESISQIIDGCLEAQKKYGIPDTEYRSDPIKFDVALTVSNEQKDKAGLAVVSGIFGIGAQTQKMAGNESISRIQFEVYAHIPTMRRVKAQQ